MLFFLCFFLGGIWEQELLPLLLFEDKSMINGELYSSLEINDSFKVYLLSKNSNEKQLEKNESLDN